MRRAVWQRAIVQNLVDNAVKFTPEGGAIRVVVRTEGAEAVLTVSDTGIGIPAEEAGRVFSRFSRGREVSGIPGSGLGLAIVKAAVDSVGGRIDFESDARGTVFTVGLPLAAADERQHYS